MMLDLDNFFNQKQIPQIEWQIKKRGKVHKIDSNFIIQKILASEGIERQHYAGMLFALDFSDKDIMEYLHHLAKYHIVTKSKKV